MTGRPQNTLTIFGRKAVLEALQSNDTTISRLHLADTNKPSDIIRQIEQLAKQRSVEVRYHNKLALSRISRNSKQDQGVAADIHCPSLQSVDNLLAQPAQGRLLALDRINNPQNLGMIIRSASAGGMSGIILPTEAGNTQLSPLAIKASVGTAFTFPIYQCNKLAKTLTQLKNHGFDVVSLSSNANHALAQHQPSKASIFVLGNETEGVTPQVADSASQQLKIPMANDVESLNVAVTAALIAFMTQD